VNAHVLTREEVRELALRLLRGGNEKPKLEFKRYLDDLGLAITISAIANTDGDSSNNPLLKVEGLLDDYGMLILGVDDETGELVGLPEESPEWIRTGKTDQVATQLEQKLEKWIRPVPHTDVYVFDEDDGRRWVVVLIAPSLNQPHVFAKNNSKYQRGQWVVRRGRRIELPDDSEHARVHRKPVSRLESKIRIIEARLTRRLKRLEDRLSAVAIPEEGRGDALALDGAGTANGEIIVESGSDAVQATAAPPPEARLEIAVSPSEALRHYLAPPPDPIAEQIDRAFDEFTDSLTELDLSWAYVPANKEDLANTVRALEEAAFELVRALAVLVANDTEGTYADQVRERLVEYALEHARAPVGVSYNYGAMALHAYPGVLLENALAVTAHAHRNAHYLSLLAKARVRDHNDRPLPWVPEVRDRAVHASDWLNAMLPRRMCDPLSERAMVLLLDDPGLLREHLPRHVRDARRLFTEAELVLSMIALENTRGERAYFGRYVYTSDSQKAACNLLTQEHGHLTGFLHTPLKEALQGLWGYFGSLTGHLPCPKMIVFGWPECLEPPEQE